MSSAEIAAAGIQDVYYFEFPDDGYDEMASPADDNVITPSPTPLKRAWKSLIVRFANNTQMVLENRSTPCLFD